MSTLMTASNEWATRPDDERFVSLTAMRQHFVDERQHSRAITIATNKFHIEPQSDSRGLIVVGPSGNAAAGFSPTNWSFGQLCQLAEAPAGFLRTLEAKRAAPVVADVLNVCMLTRSVEEVGLLLYQNGSNKLSAATGPRYGRIWQDDILGTLIKQFGDGLTGDWRVPGEFGKAVQVTKANTTLYGSDRDMFIFLADEQNKIEVPKRRASLLGSSTGLMSRGFFLSNGMYGDRSFRLSTFYFDYVCCNRIVWGAEGFEEIQLRHTSSAPDKWLEELIPALDTYRQRSTLGITQSIKAAQEQKLADDVDAYLATRFGKRMVGPLQAVHMLEEQRPIETVWDAATAVTAYAKSVKWQDDRVALERSAGELLELVAA